MHEADVTDPAGYRAELAAFAPEALIHFAGLKAVGEAVEAPLEYYRVNVGGSLALFREMDEIACNRLVFSSSATVYGDPETVPIPEDHPLRPTNPYGASKRMVEQVIEDWGRANPALAAINLRYFNPVGAHPSARIGEAPQGVPQEPHALPWPRWRQDGATSSPSSATTGRPPTAPAYATISMSWIWPPPISPRWS